MEKFVDQLRNDYRRSYRRCNSSSLTSNFGRRASRRWEHIRRQFKLYNSHHDYRARPRFCTNRIAALVLERKTLQGITRALSSTNKPGWIPSPSVLGSSQVYFISVPFSLFPLGKEKGTVTLELKN